MNHFKTAISCMCKPCCYRSSPIEFRDSVEREYDKKAFDIVYHGEMLGRMSTIPVVGDTVFGYTVWCVDYKERIAYVTK